MKIYTVNQRLIKFIDSIIRENKKVTLDGYELNVHDLYEDDRDQFVAHLIECDSFNKVGWDWLFEDSFREEIISSFTASILEHDYEERQYLRAVFFDTLKQSATKINLTRMQTMINDRLSIVQSEDIYEYNHDEDAA